MRSIWTGAIGFGLVTIPVKVYSATEDSSLSFDMLDKKNHSRIRYRRVSEDTGKEIPWNDIVKGYEVNGKYVVLTDEDFKAASPEKTQRIEIFQFVNLSEIDSVYFETPYYLEPDKNGGKPYLLLMEALAKSGMAGVGSFVMRNREHLVVIKPYGNALILNRIRFAEEIRKPDTLKLPAKNAVKDGEMKMAMALIKQMTEKFDISSYKDVYDDQLMKLIKAKSKGAKPKVPHMKVVHKQSTDLMEQLKASLGKPARKAS